MKFDCTVFDLIFFNSKIYPELAAGSKLKTGTQLQVHIAIIYILGAQLQVQCSE